METGMLKKHWPIIVLVVVTIVVTIWSGIHPHERDTWVFEMLFGWVGLAILLAVYPWFRFSSLAYLAVAFFVVILSWGAKYTYAAVPWFNWLEDTLALSRNHADRFGHFFQGFTPAIVTRELLIRTSTLKRGAWLSVVTVSMCLAFNAFYELLEMWWVSAFYGTEDPGLWLGHQDDVWDAQWDMTMALMGATLAVLAFSWLHDRTMKAVTDK